MSILGTLVDSTTAQTFAAGALGAGTTSFASHIHSLPATAAETVLPVMTSLEQVAGTGHRGFPHLLACGSNASVVTIGFAIPTGMTIPTVGYNVTAVVWHSTIR